MYKATVLYRRASSDKQTLESQEPELRRWAELNGVEYDPIDDIATGRNMARRGIQAVIAGIKSGQTKRVVVVCLSRVGRNVRQVAEFIDLCDENAVTLISLREGFDLGTPFGRVIAYILSAMNQLENEMKSESTRAGIQAARLKAKKEGRVFKMGGSRKGHSLKVTQPKADSIISLRAKGYSYRKIGEAVALSEKTCRMICLNPRERYMTRSEQAKRAKR